MGHVDIELTRVFPYPVDIAYGWLTDYQDDDPQRTNAVVMKRNVTRRDAREVDMDVELITVGRRMKGPATIRLFPEEKRYQAVAAGGKMVYDYRLTPTPEGGARLDVRYRVSSRRWTRRLTIWLAKPKLKRELHQMWDGFTESMKRELGPERMVKVA